MDSEFLYVHGTNMATAPRHFRWRLPNRLNWPRVPSFRRTPALYMEQPRRVSERAFRNVDADFQSDRVAIM